MNKPNNRDSRRNFIRHAPPRYNPHHRLPPTDPEITIDRQRLYDLIDSLESLSGE